MKIKTSELTGAALNWAVAKCEGFVQEGDEPWERGYEPFAFSTDWSQGGPIIEREFINVTYDDLWTAEDVYGETQWGDTPLIAAMRCFVASSLGDEVDVPEELLQ